MIKFLKSLVIALASVGFVLAYLIILAVIIFVTVGYLLSR